MYVLWHLESGARRRPIYYEIIVQLCWLHLVSRHLGLCLLNLGPYLINLPRPYQLPLRPIHKSTIVGRQLVSTCCVILDFSISLAVFEVINLIMADQIDASVFVSELSLSVCIFSTLISLLCTCI